MYIGEKIHELRKSKKISLVELSKLSGVQVATLSRIENKKMVGTLESHINIAKALEIDVTELYHDINDPIDFSPQSEEPVEVFIQEDSSKIDFLTKDVLKKKMLPTIIHLKANATTSIEQHKMSTERFLYALKGTTHILIKDKTYILKEGTSLYFNSSLPHRFNNPSKSDVSILCVTTPAVL